MSHSMKNTMMKNPGGQLRGGEVVASTAMASKESDGSIMDEDPHEDPDRGRTTPRKM